MASIVENKQGGYKHVPSTKYRVPGIGAQATDVAIGPSQGPQSTWSEVYGLLIDNEGWVYLLRLNKDTEEWGPKELLLRLLNPVADAVLTFDSRGFPIVGFARRDGSYGVWYKKDGLNTLQELGTGANPSIRVIPVSPETRVLSDTILVIIKGQKLLEYRLSFNFTNPLQHDIPSEKKWFGECGVDSGNQILVELL